MTAGKNAQEGARRKQPKEMKKRIVTCYVYEKDHYAREFPDKEYRGTENTPERLVALKMAANPQPLADLIEVVRAVESCIADLK